MMDRHEEELARVLQALREAEPAPGMEQRVLARLAETTTSAEHPLQWAWLLGALSLAGALGVFVSLAILHHAAKPGVVATAAAPTVAIPSPTNSHPTVSHETTPQARLPNPPTVAGKANVLSVPISRGLADLPSSPEEPLPTTDQERLLVHLAHGPSQQEFALLNPVVRERLAQQSNAEFTKFFPPPTPQELYLAEHSND